jgi:hypothetical protein
MRILPAFSLLLAFQLDPCAAAGAQATLHDRCAAAIAASGQPADAKALKQSAIPLGEQGFIFQFEDAAGGTFSCQACDDGNPAVNVCGSIGVELSYRPKEGELKRLPSEIDKKCSYFLQKEIAQRSSAGGMPFVHHDIVQRIHVSADHTDTRWVYNMELDGNAYRCVVRKNDGNFRVEKQNGADWRPIAAGTLF